MNLAIDTAYFHQMCITTLYASLVVLAFVIVERLVYYALLNARVRGLAALVHGAPKQTLDEKQVDAIFKRRDLITRSVAQYIAAVRERGISRTRLEDLSASQFIKINGAIGARLWLLDTIVTAAPLLGLLGTILGIMDTFNALSAGGISDPAAVSRGIASALLATAIGIGTALFGLLGHNLLHRIADHLTEEYKRLLLLAEDFTARDAKAKPAAVVGSIPAIGEGTELARIRAR